MRIVIVALTAIALARSHAAELLNADFEDLKSGLLARGASRKTVSRMMQHLKRPLMVKLSWNAIRGLSPFIIPMVFIPS